MVPQLAASSHFPEFLIFHLLQLKADKRQDIETFQ
jgi:hypothetical protein